MGVPGNEKADRLAKEAASRVAPPRPVPFRDTFPTIRLAIEASWQHRWDVSVATSKMGEITKSVHLSWQYTHIRNRSSQTLLTRLRIGHSRLSHGYLMSRDFQAYCDDCLVPLTVRHLLVECPSLLDLRHRYLYRCRGRSNGVYSLARMLGPACLAPGYDVVGFLQEAGFLSRL